MNRVIFSLLCIVLSFLSYELSAANRFWVASSPSNWNASANWSATSGGSGGAGVPTSADAVVFDNGGLGSCTIDMVIAISSLSINSGYSGTITQGANTIAISMTAVFSSGTFAGGSANITITGAFTLSGTAFTSTSATLEFKDNSAFTSGTFSHNNGTVKYNSTNTSAQTISGTSPTFYTLEFVGLGKNYAISSTGSIVVLNSLNTSGTLFHNLNTGTIDVRGDINIANSATGNGGDATININGTGTQNYVGSSTAGQGALPKMIINKSSGTLNLSNNLAVANDFTYTAGTINAGTSTFCFIRGSAGSYTISGSLTLNNITFTVNSGGATVTIASGTTLTANGILTIAGTGNVILNTGAVNSNGNINLTNTATGGGGTATINISGTIDQTIDGTAIIVNQSRLPIININKPSGTLFLSGNISFSANVTLTAGAINAATSTFNIVNNLTITGSFSVYNLTIATSGSVSITIASGATITVTNDFTLAGGTSNIGINTGTIAAQGNIIITNTATGGGGTGTILINGTGTQTISSTGVVNQGKLSNVTINKAGLNALILPALITVVGSWTYTAGVLVTTGSTVVFNNTLTITGSHTLNNVEFMGSGNFTFTITAGTILTVNGSMAISGSNNVGLNTGTINLLGDLNLTNTGTAGGGTAVIAFIGITNQAITGSLAINQSRLPLITINKLSGTLTFPSLITVRGNWTYTTGTYDVVTNNSTIVFGNSLTVSGDHTLNNVAFDGSGNYTISLASVTLTVNGDMSISGTAAFPNNNVTLNGGTINLKGNLILTNTGSSGGGTTVIALIGTSNQSITSSLLINQCNLPAVTINKASGTLTFPPIITVRGNWTYTAGTIDAAINNSTVAFNNNLTFTGSHSLNNVNLEGNFNNTYTVSTGTILTITGTLTTSGSSNVGLSTPVSAATAIQAQGDIIINNTSAAGGGTGAILINGTGNQSFTGNSSASLGRLPFVKIQKVSGTLTMSGTISISQSWTYVSGTVDATTSTLVCGGNSLSISSTGMALYSVTVSANTTTLSNSLTLNGNLTMNGTGILSPGSSTMNLKGNWSNYGTAGFVRGTSTLILNGTLAQTISNSAGETFYNLTMSNSSSTGATLSTGTVTVTNALTLTSGKIYTTSSNLLILNSGATSTSGSASSFVDGPMKKIGNQAFVFPLGNGTVWARLGINAPTVATDAFTTQYFASPYSTLTSMATTPVPVLLNVSPVEYWVCDRTTGTSNTTVTLYWESAGRSGISLFTSDLKVAHWNGSAWENVGQSAITASSSGSVTSNALTSYSPITFGSLTGSITLPIELLNFEADVNNNQRIHLTWETASEINNDHFDIERSSNGRDFEIIGRVKGSGTTSQKRSYSFNDENPVNSASYYRLNQIDYDGAFTYSKVIAVHLDLRTESVFSVYPNPASKETVYFTQKVSITVLNSINQVVLSDQDVRNFDATILPAGIYTIRNQTGQVARLVVK